ncbi:MAG: poly-gamma-glutamate synthase PgsB [Spirochaetaceae bacterium]|nr:poly-gamma-glutamate synthase PgsB [Spirochaetaceae bacterium]
MISAGWAAGCALGGLTLAGILEKHAIMQAVRHIPLRILVNGTRGKSTVTRLIAAALRAGGISVMAKVTGSAARLIDLHGEEQAIPRKGRASVMEHGWFMREAARAGAEAIVAECMAIRPDTSRAVARMTRPTMAVLTNVRLDHPDTMGPDILSVAQTLSETIPEHGVLLVPEEAFGPEPALAAVLAAADRCHTSVIRVGVSDRIREGARLFPYPMPPQNLALAMEVCSRTGVEYQCALNGMLAANPDPGVVPVLEILLPIARLLIINAFAANDLASSLLLKEEVLAGRMARGLDVPASWALVYNHRQDRPWRLDEAVATAMALEARMILVMGVSSGLVRHRLLTMARRAHTERDRALLRTEQIPIRTISPHPDELGRALQELVSADRQERWGPSREKKPFIGVLMTGNIKGDGMQLTEALLRQAESSDAEAGISRSGCNKE